MQAKLQGLDNVGAVIVARSGADRVGGYSWTVTFVSETANVNEMGVASNDLTAGALRLDSDQQASVNIDTRLNGSINTHVRAATRGSSAVVAPQLGPPLSRVRARERDALLRLTLRPTTLLLCQVLQRRDGVYLCAGERRPVW